MKVSVARNCELMRGRTSTVPPLATTIESPPFGTWPPLQFSPLRKAPTPPVHVWAWAWAWAWAWPRGSTSIAATARASTSRRPASGTTAAGTMDEHKGHEGTVRRNVARL